MRFPRPRRTSPVSTADLRAWERLRTAHLGVSLARQHRLALLPAAAGDWSLDLSSARAQVGTLETRISLLGTSADESSTWMMGWATARLNELDPAIAMDAESARLAAEASGCSLLSRDTLSFDEASPAEVASVISVLAGPAPLYRGPHAAGAVWFSLLDVELRDPLPTTSVCTVLQELAALDLADHRAGAAALLVAEGFVVEDDLTLRAHRARDVLELSFDELHRLAGVTAHLSGDAPP